MDIRRLTHVRPEVSPEVSVRDTVKVMSDSAIGAIAVRDGAKLVGIFSERDLLRRVVGQGRDPITTAVKDVMTSGVVTAAESTSVENGAAIMRAHHIHHLVVVDQTGDYVGIVSHHYLLQDLTRDLALQVDDLTAYLMTDGAGG